MRPLRKLNPDQIATETEELLGVHIEAGRRHSPAETLLAALHAAEVFVLGLMTVGQSDETESSDQTDPDI